MENTKTPVNSFSFQFRRNTRVSYTNSSYLKDTVSMVIHADAEDEALEKAKSVSKELTASSEYYSFELLSIIER